MALNRYLIDRGKEDRLALAKTLPNDVKIHYVAQDPSDKYGTAVPVAMVVEEFNIDDYNTIIHTTALKDRELVPIKVDSAPVTGIKDGFENDPIKIWESNIFGKSLHELVNEGLQNKLARMPEDAQGKLQETLERIVNEGSGGLICIIL